MNIYHGGRVTSYSYSISLTIWNITWVFLALFDITIVTTSDRTQIHTLSFQLSNTVKYQNLYLLFLFLFIFSVNIFESIFNIVTNLIVVHYPLISLIYIAYDTCVYKYVFFPLNFYLCCPTAKTHSSGCNELENGL